MRRTVMKGRILGIKDVFIEKLAEAAIELSEGCDPAVKLNKGRICGVLAQVTRTISSCEWFMQSSPACLTACCMPSVYLGGASVHKDVSQWAETT